MTAINKVPALEFKINKRRKKLSVLVNQNAKNKQYWLTLQSANGNKIMHTEQYKSKKSAYKIVKLLSSIIDDTKVVIHLKDQTPKIK